MFEELSEIEKVALAPLIAGAARLIPTAVSAIGGLAKRTAPKIGRLGRKALPKMRSFV
jgi:hypothetical protein